MKTRGNSKQRLKVVLSAGLLLAAGAHTARCEVAPTTVPDMCSARMIGASPTGAHARAVVMKSKYWKKHEIGVKFMEGDPIVQARVEECAKIWSQYANINFNFQSAKPEIRIRFQENKGSWSAIGTDALRRATDDCTLNFGWFNRSTPMAEIRRTTLHEFGHVLGFMHEHESPNAQIPWNREKVYEYYATHETPPWSREQVNAQVLERIPRSQVSSTQFDRYSIMLYPISPELTTNGYSTPKNWELSPLDKWTAASVYGRPKGQPEPSPTPTTTQPAICDGQTGLWLVKLVEDSGSYTLTLTSRIDPGQAPLRLAGGTLGTEGSNQVYTFATTKSDGSYTYRVTRKKERNPTEFSLGVQHAFSEQESPCYPIKAEEKTDLGPLPAEPKDERVLEARSASQLIYIDKDPEANQLIYTSWLLNDMEHRARWIFAGESAESSGARTYKFTVDGTDGKTVYELTENTRTPGQGTLRILHNGTQVGATETMTVTRGK